jgi:photosystem II stability/assembly factor-like uncharacterized protein
VGYQLPGCSVDLAQEDLVKRFGVAAVGIALALGLAAPTAVAAPQPGDRWQTPTCAVVKGDGSISFTRNEGRTITPTSVPQQPLQYVFGMVAVGTNTLLAVDHRNVLQSSTDAGCTWSRIGAVEGMAVPRLAAVGDGSAYVWDQNGTSLFRVKGDTVTALPPVAEGYGYDPAAFAVNRYFPRHLRLVMDDGSIRDSFDAGATFQTTAEPAKADLFVYNAAIDPTNVNHIVVGTMSEGAYTTWLGGAQWTRSTLGAPEDAINVFSVEMSPVNPFVVWAQGINQTENNAGVPSEGRHVYRSTDGGRTFKVAVDHVPGEVTLVNGPLLAAHPTNPDVLYFVFGTSYAAYGTDLFRYDARRGSLSVRHNDNDGIDSIVFNPRDPGVMYLGFAAE